MPARKIRNGKKKIAEIDVATDPVEVAEEAGLRYVSDEQPGYTRKAKGDCTCPSDEWPCKHVRALRATWEMNPDSFLDVKEFLRGLDTREKTELIETIGKIVLAFPQTLGLFGIAGFGETDDDDGADDAWGD